MSTPEATESRLLSILRGSELFLDLTQDEMDRLIIHMRMIRAQKGFEIIRQGDSWDSFYVILSGRVSVKIRKGSKTLKMEVLEKGDFFGEMALIANKPRNATITSESVSELLVLKKDDFDSLLMNHPNRASKILGAYARRKKRNKTKLVSVL
jgi:CRP-like cAMP-binding protein